jgi:ribosomal protein S18 acetylase RimI-like enzyme
MPQRKGAIRPASSDDVDRVRSVAREAYARYIPRIGREPLPMLADFAAEIAAGHVVVIEVDGSIVGYMVAWAESEAYLIENIAVASAWQGNGRGRQLIDYAIREARRLRLAAVRLYTNVAMTENLSIYARLGFVETHRAWEAGAHRVYLRLAVTEPMID